MNSAKRLGRRVGLLFLAQLLLAPPVYTEAGMMRAVIAPGYLANAAADATQIRLAVLLVFVLGALTLAMALTALPLVRRHSERLALLYVALGVLGLATQAIESVTTRNLVSLSLAYTTAGAPRELLETLGSMARAAWSSAHFTNLMVGHVTMFVLFVILLRCALVPRALAVLGLLTTLLSTTAATMPLLGYPFSYVLVAPTGLVTLVLTLWLVVKGFEERPEPTSPPTGAGRTDIARVPGSS